MYCDLIPRVFWWSQGFRGLGERSETLGMKLHMLTDMKRWDVKCVS